MTAFNKGFLGQWYINLFMECLEFTVNKLQYVQHNKLSNRATASLIFYVITVFKIKQLTFIITITLILLQQIEHIIFYYSNILKKCHLFLNTNKTHVFK